MKILNRLIIIILILLIPIQIFSKEDCTVGDINITGIDLLEKTDTVKENNSPIVDDLKVNVDLTFYQPDAEIAYKVIIKNNSENDYKLKEDTLEKTEDYIKYDIQYEDNNVIKPNEEKDIVLKITYTGDISKEKFNNGIFLDNQSLTIPIYKDEKLSINPPTGILFFLIIIVLINIYFIAMIGKKQREIITLNIIAFVFLIPFVVNSKECNVKMKINNNITIDRRESTFITGQDLNLTMKKLGNPAAGDITDPFTVDTTISSFKKSDILAENIATPTVVSTTDSEYPIYMWFDAGTIYYYTEASTIYLNEDSSKFFLSLKSIQDISGLTAVNSSKVTNMNQIFARTESLENIDAVSKWNTSSVTDISYLLYNAVNIKDIKGLKNWDTSKVTTLQAMFFNCKSVETFDDIKNWNVSNVIDMSALLYYCSGIENVDFLENWDVSNVNNMRYLLAYCTKLKDINGLKKWNVSKVTNMEYLLSRCQNLIDISGLSNWDVSNVTNMSRFFTDCSLLEDLSPLQNWNVSNLVDAYDMFRMCGKVSDFSPLSNWNVSKLENMQGMFHLCESLKNLDCFRNWDVSSVKNMAFAFDRLDYLEDASGINDWDINNVTNFTYIFALGTTTVTLNPVHPEFSKRPGTWDQHGTFIPNQ